MSIKVVTFEEVRIYATTVDSRVLWRDDRVMTKYIYNTCSNGPENNIFWEEGKTSFLGFKKITRGGGGFLSPFPSTPQTPG